MVIPLTYRMVIVHTYTNGVAAVQLRLAYVGKIQLIADSLYLDAGDRRDASSMNVFADESSLLGPADRAISHSSLSSLSLGIFPRFFSV